jgi:hypothetical protein
MRTCPWIKRKAGRQSRELFVTRGNKQSAWQTFAIHGRIVAARLWSQPAFMRGKPSKSAAMALKQAPATAWQ